MLIIITDLFILEPAVHLNIEIFSGSASGSSEEEDLCESSNDVECGSGYPEEYEIVDEDFNKDGVDKGTQGIFICLQTRTLH